MAVVDLEQYLRPWGLEKIREAVPEEISPKKAKKHAGSLRNLLWDVIERAEEDVLRITPEFKDQLFGLADLYHRMAERTGNPKGVLVGNEQSTDQVRDGFKKVIELNFRIQNGEKVEDVFRDLSGGLDLSELTTSMSS